MILNSANNTIAVGAVSSPLWLPSIAQLSEMAALALPILGCIWLLVQIVGYINNHRKDK